MPPLPMSSPPRTFELRVSKMLRAALVVLAGAAAVAVWRSDLPRAGLLVIPCCFWLAWRQLHLGPWRELVLRGDGTAVIGNAAGEAIEVAPVDLQRRGPLWVLRLRQDGRTQSLLFGPDTLDAPQRRQLRLWMERHGRGGLPPGAGAHV